MAEGRYALPRGLYPSARLNFQFYLWQEAIGFNVHPSIDLTKPDLKIAEVATGTGIWLTELSNRVPASAHLHGFDLSADQFPHESCLPANVRLRTWDATQDPPEDMLGVYDVVHIRLLCFAIEDDDPSPILRQCRKLLKPGGFFQWDEIILQAIKSFSPQEELLTPCLQNFCDIFVNVKPIGWVPKLHEFFEKHGLDVVANEVHMQKQWQRQAIMENWCLLVDELAQELERGGAVEKAGELRSVIIGAYDEIKRGGFYTQPMQVVVGRAPA